MGSGQGTGGRPSELKSTTNSRTNKRIYASLCSGVDHKCGKLNPKAPVNSCLGKRPTAARRVVKVNRHRRFGLVMVPWLSGRQACIDSKRARNRTGGLVVTAKVSTAEELSPPPETNNPMLDKGRTTVAIQSPLDLTPSAAHPLVCGRDDPLPVVLHPLVCRIKSALTALKKRVFCWCSWEVEF